jgi:PASTA domain
MGLIKTGFSAIGKFFIVLTLAAAFIVGMVGVVYMSLRGEEVKIPEIVGKNVDESEKELAALGLKLKRIANRYSGEKPETILEQRPRAGDTAKTGLMISVIVAQANPEGTEAPADVRKKGEDEDDIEEIEELISDKPKKSNKSNTNSNKKKSSTTRDIIKEKGNQNSDSADEGNSNSDSKSDSTGKENKTGTGNSNNKQTTPANSNKSNPNKSQPGTTKPTGGDPRPRKTPVSN